MQEIYDQGGIAFNAWTNVPEKDIACYRWVQGEPDYPTPAEAVENSTIPHGSLIAHTWESKTVYPGVSGTYELYVSAQYRPEQAAVLFIFLDGSTQYIQQAKVPSILDSMIHTGDIPPVIAIFHNSGNPGPGLPRYGGTDHRSIEYDATDDKFAIFLEDEILCPLYAAYNITKDPKKRVICGISSGGNAAFAAAWHRPDLFGKVISHCGSFTAIRGGEQFPYLIRQCPRKPIKVFLQSGEHDLNTCFGDWKLANQTMASALAYKDYDYKLEIGPGGHSVKYGASLLPETIRWILT